MKHELKQRILEFNRANAKNKEAADDFMKLLSALPSGQAKNLKKDKTCAEILDKYGIS